MATTGISIQLNATDGTAAAVAAARGRFAAFAQSIQQTTSRVSVLSAAGGGISRFASGLVLAHRSAIALAAGFERFSAPIRRVLAEMHELSDRAVETGSTASGLLSLSYAFEELGVKNTSVESLATMLDRMRKTTGELGVDGFKRVMAQIGAIGDETKRSAELVRVFGREGSRLEFLLRKGPDALLQKLDALEKALPRFSENALQNLAGIDKGFHWISRDISAGWKQMLVDCVSALDKSFTGPADLQLALFWEGFKTSAKEAALYVSAVLLTAADVIASAIEAIWDTISLVSSAVYDLGKDVWNTITFDFDNVNFKHTENAWKDFADDFDIGAYWTAAENEIAALEEDLYQRQKAIRAAFEGDFGPASDLSDAADDLSEALDDSWKLGDAATKISDALNPARWTDAASYAARSLAASFRDLSPFLNPARPRGLFHSFRESGSASGVESIKPVVTQLLDAVRDNGRAARSFYDSLQLEAV